MNEKVVDTSEVLGLLSLVQKGMTELAQLDLDLKNGKRATMSLTDYVSENVEPLVYLLNTIEDKIFELE